MWKTASVLYFKMIIEQNNNFIDLENGYFHDTSSLKDEHELIKILNKTPILENVNIGKIVRGDQNSNILTFEIDRFYDGMDLSTKGIQLIVKVGNTISPESASNLQYNNDSIRFSWVMSYFATSQKEVTVAIEFYGTVDDYKDYSLKTTPFTISIEDSLNENDSSVLLNDGSNNTLVNLSNRLIRLEEIMFDIETSRHSHDNIDTLNKISETSDGILLFDGKEITSSGDGNGIDGEDGKSAYEIAVEHGFDGTEEEWLESLKGEKGDPGKDGTNGSGDQSSVEYDVLTTSVSVKENTTGGKLVDALVIKEVFQSVSDGKELLASAITDKGVDTDATDSFEIMANNISNIQSDSDIETSVDMITQQVYWKSSFASLLGVLIHYDYGKPIKKLIVKQLTLNGAMYSSNYSSKYIFFDVLGIKFDSTSETSMMTKSLLINSETTKSLILEDLEINLDDYPEYEKISFFRIRTSTASGTAQYYTGSAIGEVEVYF